jgi:hypothetical protein
LHYLPGCRRSQPETQSCRANFKGTKRATVGELAVSLLTYPLIVAARDNLLERFSQRRAEERHDGKPGLGFSPTLDSGPAFTCIVTGDPRLPEAAYPFLRRKLDSLLRGRLPTVRIVWRTPGADDLAARYARERRLDISFVADRSAEVLDKVSPDAVVVFDAGGQESAELVRAARERKMPVRVVDVRRFVLPARS